MGAGFDDVPAVYQVDDSGVKECTGRRDPLPFAHTQFFSAVRGVESTRRGSAYVVALKAAPVIWTKRLVAAGTPLIAAD